MPVDEKEIAQKRQAQKSTLTASLIEAAHDESAEERALAAEAREYLEKDEEGKFPLALSMFWKLQAGMEVKPEIESHAWYSWATRALGGIGKHIPRNVRQHVAREVCEATLRDFKEGGLMDDFAAVVAGEDKKMPLENPKAPEKNSEAPAEEPTQQESAPPDAASADASAPVEAAVPPGIGDWMGAYTRHLEACIKEMPDKYAYGIEQLPEVLERMEQAFRKGSYNHDSPAIKRTCKELGIKHTRKEIDQFIKEGRKAPAPATASEEPAEVAEAAPEEGQGDLFETPEVTDEILTHYFTTALWSSTDYDENDPESDRPMDENYTVEDISDEAWEQGRKDLQSFFEQAGPLLKDEDLAVVAHDFWLTRNGHGAGFWDGDYEKEKGRKLTEISKKFGELHPIAGDDGKVYVEGNAEPATANEDEGQMDLIEKGEYDFHDKESQKEALGRWIDQMAKWDYEYATKHVDSGNNYLEIYMSEFSVDDLLRINMSSNDLWEPVNAALAAGLSKDEVTEILKDLAQAVPSGVFYPSNAIASSGQLGEVETQLTGIGGEVNGKRVNDMFEALSAGLTPEELKEVGKNLDETYWDGERDYVYSSADYDTWMFVVDPDAFVEAVNDRLADMGKDPIAVESSTEEEGADQATAAPGDDEGQMDLIDEPLDIDNQDQMINELVAHFGEEFREDIESSYDRNGGQWAGWGDTGGFSKEGEDWTWIRDEGEANRIATEHVRQMLENEPEMFSKDWLSNYMKIYDTDRRIIAGEEADAYIESLGEDRDQILSEGERSTDVDEIMDDDSIEDKEAALDALVEGAKDTIRDNRYKEVYDALADPIQYFCHDLGAYSEEDLMKQTFISIDVEKATRDAILTDGWAHFLSSYDGGYDLTPKGLVVFRHN